MLIFMSASFQINRFESIKVEERVRDPGLGEPRGNELSPENPYTADLGVRHFFLCVPGRDGFARRGAGETAAETSGGNSAGKASRKEETKKGKSREQWDIGAEQQRKRDAGSGRNSDRRQVL